MTGRKHYTLRRRETRCYETFDVVVAGETIGCIQRLDSTVGWARSRHPRDRWLVWVGNPHRGAPGGPESQLRSMDDAIDYILGPHQ